jgi:hypothetical protein
MNQPHCGAKRQPGRLRGGALMLSNVVRMSKLIAVKKELVEDVDEDAVLQSKLDAIIGRKKQTDQRCRIAEGRLSACQERLKNNLKNLDHPMVIDAQKLL